MSNHARHVGGASGCDGRAQYPDVPALFRQCRDPLQDADADVVCCPRHALQLLRAALACNDGVRSLPRREAQPCDAVRPVAALAPDTRMGRLKPKRCGERWSPGTLLQLVAIDTVFLESDRPSAMKIIENVV